MMNTIDVSKARTSQNKFAHASLTTDRGKIGLSQAGKSTLHGGLSMGLKSEILGGTRYSKFNVS